MGKPVKWEPKRPYSKPTLTVYGTLLELTQKKGHTSSLDGQTIIGQPNRTGV